MYAYASAPDFEILLIGYRYDGQGVKVIDLTDPLTDPERDFPDFWEGLYSPDVIKTAYNANFERTCLASWLGRPMPPSSGGARQYMPQPLAFQGHWEGWEKPWGFRRISRRIR